jgi:molybdopterin molybdotransferase
MLSFMGKMPALLSVSEVSQKILDAFRPVEIETIDINQALDRVIADDVRASFDLPVFNNSSMDGYALQADDVKNASREHPVTLGVIADIPAGQPFYGKVRHEQAARIMTGAPLPDGADCVVPVEETDSSHQQDGSLVPAQVHVFRPVKAGDYIRKQGKDAHAQELLIQHGTKLRPQEIGILAMLGMPQLQVYRRPRLAILPTGDELLPVGIPLAPGKIYESNSYALSAQVEESGGIVVSRGLIPDRLETIVDALDRAIDMKVDLIISSAGVSVGAHDFVRAAIEQNGELIFWRVNMRPGRPLAFGFYRRTPFFGLPGNPVSAFTTFEVFVRPALCKLAGQTDWHRIPIRVQLEEAVESDGRESYLRAIVTFKDGHAYARLTGNQDSGNLRSLIQANALLIIPNEVKCLPIGAEVLAWLI